MKSINELKIPSLPLYILFTGINSIITSMMLKRGMKPIVSHLKRLRNLGLVQVSSIRLPCFCIKIIKILQVSDPIILLCQILSFCRIYLFKWYTMCCHLKFCSTLFFYIFLIISVSCLFIFTCHNFSITIKMFASDFFCYYQQQNVEHSELFLGIGFYPRNETRQSLNNCLKSHR